MTVTLPSALVLSVLESALGAFVSWHPAEACRVGCHHGVASMQLVPGLWFKVWISTMLGFELEGRFKDKGVQACVSIQTRLLLPSVSLAWNLGGFELMNHPDHWTHVFGCSPSCWPRTRPALALRWALPPPSQTSLSSTSQVRASALGHESRH